MWKKIGHNLENKLKNMCVWIHELINYNENEDDKKIT